MSAELVDPFASHDPFATHEPNLTPEEWEAIRDEVFDAPWNDRSKVPDCLKEAFKTLGEIGTGISANPAREATQCLRRMVRRAVNGPYHEPIEPTFQPCTSKRCEQTALMGSCDACRP